MAKDVRRGINKLYREAAEEFARRLRADLGDRIHSIVLFGSVARKQATRESDIDVLVIGVAANVRSEVIRISSEIMLDSDADFFLSPIFVPLTDFQQRIEWRSPFPLNMLDDGVVLYDDGTYSGVYQKEYATDRRDTA